VALEGRAPKPRPFVFHLQAQVAFLSRSTHPDRDALAPVRVCLMGIFDQPLQHEPRHLAARDRRQIQCTAGAPNRAAMM